MKRLACLGVALLWACLDFNKVETQFFETDCANGLDDDGDRLVDCADPDCLGKTCATSDLCAGAPVCLSDGRCSGAPKTCDAPPAFCLAPTGTCSPATGACSYAPDTTATCDDSDLCTMNDHCGAGGGCAGTPYTCLNTECAWSACLGDGGCSAPLVRTGLLCDAGLCLESGACATFSYRPSNFDPAAIAARGIGPALTIACANAFFDSTDGGSFWCNGQPAPAATVISQDGGADVVVLAVSQLSIPSGGSLSLTGSRPVIFAVWGDATVGGALSAAGASTSPAPPTLCDAQDGVADGILAAGGGGGGSHGGRGGDGGDGDATGHGGRAGTPSGTAALVPLRGGCPGGSGGRSADPTGAGGRGGAGGGAVQISALGTLTVSGTVTASGSGGQGGLGVLSGSNGGGAGGSGGAVLLEGMDVVMPPGARLTANGGGGGGGGGVADGSTGLDGQTGSANPAPGGGSGIACAGKGGQGASALGGATAGDNATSLCSGGGGGGGLGRIRVNAFALCRDDAGVQSPAPGFGGVCP